MTGVNEIRSTFVEYFKKNGHEHVVVVAGAAQRSDADVHLRRHGAVQEPLHRPGDAHLQARRRRRRSACAPAASTTTSTTSATPRATTPSSRCSATSRSATISRTAGDRAGLEPRHQGVRARQEATCSITVYSEDEEAAALWKKIAGLPDSRIIRIATSDNFWSAGDTGPCGPCSEIFFDQGDKLQGGPPGSRRRGRRPLPRVLEPRLHAVRAARRRATACNLPKPSIDTGMGLERISAHAAGRARRTTTPTCSRR